MHFPVEGPGGNCDPESGLRVGYGFRLNGLAESGPQFPDEALDGKYIPEMAFELG